MHFDRKNFAFIDIETTGLSPINHRIIEIAILQVDEGQVVKEWSTLINPECFINGFIQNYTGIGNQDVIEAPIFAEVKDELLKLFHGRIFVAHNAKFDYGFIKNEFQRVGVDFQMPKICTGELSRILYPEYTKHGLDHLIERHGLDCQARHRAMGDTMAMWEFWKKAQDEKEEFFPAINSFLR